MEELKVIKNKRFIKLIENCKNGDIIRYNKRSLLELSKDKNLLNISMSREKRIKHFKDVLFRREKVNLIKK